MPDSNKTKHSNLVRSPATMLHRLKKRKRESFINVYGLHCIIERACALKPKHIPTIALCYLLGWDKGDTHSRHTRLQRRVLTVLLLDKPSGEPIGMPSSAPETIRAIY